MREHFEQTDQHQRLLSRVTLLLLLLLSDVGEELVRGLQDGSRDAARFFLKIFKITK